MATANLKPRRRPWLAAEIEFLRAKYHAGATDEDIAGHLQRSVSSVASARNVYGINRPRDTLKRAAEWLPEEKQIAEEMYHRGETRRAMAIALNRSEIAIKRAITTFGWRRNDEPGHINPSQWDTTHEQWRAVASIGGWYAASSLGRVMSLHPGRIGQVLSTWTDKDGYEHATLTINGRSKRIAVHRLVALAFLGAPPTNKHQVAHNDGRPSNNCARNLRWATPKENQADRLLHGTSNHRIAPELVAAAVDEVFAGISLASVARKYGIHPATLQHHHRKRQPATT